MGVAGVGWTQGTWAVGGSDSSCYALMAEAFATGKLQPRSSLADRVPWPDAPTTLAPAGFLPSPTRRGSAAPVCAPGFALVLTPFRWLLGPDGIFVVTPLAGALLVGLASFVAWGLAGAPAGALAALLVATSPIVLFQVVQPMNDILTATLWTGVLAASMMSGPRVRPAVMGSLTGVALLVRPNLALLGVVVACWMLLPNPTGGDFQGSSRRRGTRLSPFLVFSAFAAPGVLLAGALNWLLYGTPLTTGYGSPSALFSRAHIPVNLANYSKALVETQTPLLLLSAAAPLVCGRARPAWLALGLIGATSAVYLVYLPFPEWWYLRFWLPAIVPMLALASAVVVVVARRLLGEGAARLATAALAVLVGAHGIRSAQERHAFGLDQLEGRFRTAAAVVRDRLAPRTVVFAAWESGSVRYHAGREAIVWGALDPAWLDRALEWLVAEGYEPVFLVERWEEPQFRERFGDRASIGRLDWPPRFDIDRRVRIFYPADRARYFAGEFIPTEQVRQHMR